jgi:hypothetical protein
MTADRLVNANLEEIGRTKSMGCVNVEINSDYPPLVLDLGSMQDNQRLEWYADKGEEMAGPPPMLKSIKV